MNRRKLPKLLDAIAILFKPRNDFLNLSPINEFSAQWKSAGFVERAEITASFISEDDDALVTVDEVARAIDAMVVSRDARLVRKRLNIPVGGNDEEVSHAV